MVESTSQEKEQGFDASLIGTVWEHVRSERVYTVIDIYNKGGHPDGKFPEMIGYQHVDSGDKYARPWKDFKLSFSKTS